MRMASSFAVKAVTLRKVGEHVTRPCLYALLVWMVGQVPGSRHCPFVVNRDDGRLCVMSVHPGNPLSFDCSFCCCLCLSFVSK